MAQVGPRRKRPIKGGKGGSGKRSERPIAGKKKKKKNKRKSGQTLSREVSVREAAAPWNIVYGKIRLGGVLTFFDAGGPAESRARLTTHTGNQAINWVARDAGADGNDITVTIVVPTNNATLTVGLVGTNITVTVKSTGGVSESTANQIIDAIRDDPTIDALVSVNKAGGSGTGIVPAHPTTNLGGGGGTWLHLVHTLASHQITAVDKVFVDNIEVEFGASFDPRWAVGHFANRFFAAWNLGTTTQEAIADLVAQLPDKWTSAHTQSGRAHVYTIAIFKESVFTDGFPDHAFEIRGKPILDPRTGITAYSNNAALVIADYLTTPKADGGCGVSWDQINLTNLAEAADTCDEAVPVAAGGTEPRYTINTSFDVDEAPNDILEIFEQSIAGRILRFNGKWHIFPGVWREPELHITDDDIRGPIEIVVKNSVKERFNRAKGTFLDPSQSYQQVDVPPVKNATYLSHDANNENWLDIDFTAVTSPGQCQRILKIEMEKSRQGLSASFPASLRLYKTHPQSVVTWTSERYGWTEKEFVVSNIGHGIYGSADDLRVEPQVVLEETAEAIFDWDVGEENTVDIAPNTNLPNAADSAPPTNLTLASGTTELYKRLDGTVFSRLKASWTASVSPYVFEDGSYEIQYKKSADSSWSQSTTVDGSSTFHHILDVQDGVSYDVRIRSVNTLGFKSDWVTDTGHTVVGKTEAPTDVSSVTATKTDFGVLVSWPAISDIDRDEYEVRVGASWAAGTPIYRGKATSFNWNFQTAGTYVLRVKAFDTTGNESDTEATTSLTINAPEAPVVSASIIGPNAVFTWTKPTADFAIREYEIRYGASYAAGTSVAIITAKDFILPVTWGGARTFWIAARDVAGNTGAADSETITISNPNPAVSFTTSAIRNSIVFDWYEPSITSLPIRRYHIYRGFTFTEAEYLGAVDATFHTFLEQSPGDYYYQVVCEDTAGNLSTNVRGRLTRVVVPDDFFIREDQELINYLIDPGDAEQPNYLSGVPGEPASRIFLPVEVGPPVASAPVASNRKRNAAHTWEEIMLDRGWNSHQDAIDAGYSAYLTPSNTDAGRVTFEIDYEAVLGQTLISLTWVERQLGTNTVPITPTIEVSEDYVTWTTYEGFSQVFASNFRYARYHFDFQATTDFDIASIEDMRAQLFLQKERDDILVSALSTDISGTLVNFNKTFIDVQSITFQPIGTQNVTWIVDYDLASDPQDNFAYVYVWDENGDRLSIQGTLQVYGAVEAT